VSIGETLAVARSEAGLTIADVSARTRIRQALLSAIEHDDFGACGGDFYTRGHIRAFAAAVGADAEALIGEYDEAHPAARPPSLEDLARRPAPRRRPSRPVLAIGVVLVLAIIGFAADKVVAGAAGPQRLSAVSSAAQRVVRGTTSARPASSTTTPSSAATPSASPSPSAVAVTDVTPVSATAYGPDGTSDGDNSQQASLALSGDPANPWHTNWYGTASFGNLQSGTGLLLDLGRTLTATGATIQLGGTSGADFQLRAGTTTSDLTTVATDSGAGGLVRLRLSSPVHARYLLIWFTLLPPDNAGTYQADVSDVTAIVTP